MLDGLMDLRRARAAGEHLRVLDLAQALLDSPEGMTDREAIEAAASGHVSAIAVERVFVAQQFANSEWALADGTGDMDLIAMATYRQGTAALYIGDYALAEEKLTRAVEIDTPARSGLDRHRGAILYNLADALMRRKNYDAASVKFRQARDVFAEAKDAAGVIRCHLQAAWAELMAGRPEPAGAYLEQAVDGLAECQDADLQNTSLTNRALYHLRMQELPEAVNLCREIMAPGRAGVTALHLSDASWIAGEAALLQGLLPVADTMAAIALDEGRKANWPPAQNRATDLRRRVFEAGQQGA